MPVSRKKAVDFNALTPRDIFENITNHYDCTGRVSFALFSFPVSSIKSEGLRRINDSVIQIEFDCATMQLFRMINVKFNLQPKFDGYECCSDHRLIFNRIYKDEEVNQKIEIICRITSWSLCPADEEQFYKLNETIRETKEESDAY